MQCGHNNRVDEGNAYSAEQSNALVRSHYNIFCMKPNAFTVGVFFIAFFFHLEPDGYKLHDQTRPAKP